MKRLIVILLCMMSLSVFGQSMVMHTSGKTRVVESGGSPSPLLTNLIAYYSFEEASGNLIDVSDNSYDMTPAGTPTYQQVGANGYSIAFSAANTSYFENSSFWDQGTDDMTISVWIYVTQTGAHNGICGTYGTVPRMWLRATDVNEWQAYWQENGGTGYQIDNGSVSGNTWYNWVWRVDRSGYSALWINGVAQADSIDISSQSGDDIVWASDFQIGNVGGTTFYFTGRIDELGVWNRLLSTSEISDLYNSGTALTYPFE